MQLCDGLGQGSAGTSDMKQSIAQRAPPSRGEGVQSSISLLVHRSPADPPFPPSPALSVIGSGFNQP